MEADRTRTCAAEDFAVRKVLARAWLLHGRLSHHEADIVRVC